MLRISLAALALLALVPCAQAATETMPTPLTIYPLDVSTVTTGGTAVTAIAAGGHARGGFIMNPVGAAQNLCINEAGTSTTTAGGSIVCIAAGVVYTLSPSNGPVSVISSDSAHPFSGYGLK
jgi:hypothetical protein